jgi:hypothetical protein
MSITAHVRAQRVRMRRSVKSLDTFMLSSKLLTRVAGVAAARAGAHTSGHTARR